MGDVNLPNRVKKQSFLNGKTAFIFTQTAYKIQDRLDQHRSAYPD
jgi:hypothetical protein